MSILNRLHDHLRLKIRENATRDALEALSPRQLADLGLEETDLSRLARLAAQPAAAGCTIEELATLVRETGDAGVSPLSLFLGRLLGAASITRDGVVEGHLAARAASERSAEAA